MNARSLRWILLFIGIGCLISASFSTLAQADGSIRFDGISSKLQNNSANVLGSSEELTFCAWVYLRTLGEGNDGILVALDPTASGMWIQCASGPKLAFIANFGITDGSWTFPVTTGRWISVAISYSKAQVEVDPKFRIDFVDVPPVEVSNPDGSSPNFGTGYCIGNLSGQNFTWDGRIAHVQIFNRILTVDEMDACLQAPGSVTNGLRLWLPMTSADDISDRSTNGFHGTPTALVSEIDGPMITNQPGVVSGVTILSHGVTNVTRHIIPRYANGVDYPAGQLRGSGPASVIRATAGTESASPNGVVATEEYEYPIAEWQSDTETTRKAVLQATVRDLSVAGYDETGTDYEAGGLVFNEPAMWNPIIGSIASTTGLGTSPINVTTHAEHTLQTGNQVEIVGILGNMNANGTRTITVKGPFSFDLNGSSPSGNYDPASKGVWKSSSRWPDKYHGLLLKGSGLLVKNVNLFYFPGTPLTITDGGAGGPTGPKLPFDREISRVWDCKVNRAYRGFLIDTDAAVGRLEGFKLRDYGIKFTKPGARIDGSIHFYGVGGGGVDQPAVWFATGADGCSGGPIYAENAPVAILIESSGNALGPIYSHTGFTKNVRIKGERNTLGPIDINVLANATGITIQGPYHKLVGGSFELWATSALGVQIESGSGSGNGLVIRDMRFYGRQSPATGTAFTTAAVLNNCTIKAHFQNVGTGMNLYPNGVPMIGANNMIDITVDPFTVTTDIILPPTWDDVTNRIIVNGVTKDGSP
jgi:hypothetical protein